jgi:predicted transport protein
MADLDKALETQLANIERKTGKTLAELSRFVLDSGLEKHGEMVAMLKSELGMGHGDANTLIHVARGNSTRGASGEDTLSTLYTDKKAHLRPIHDRLLEIVQTFGDMEEAPKKTYVSYRRKRQFAMIGPASNTQVELGLNVKGLDTTDRLEALPPGKMCNFRVRISSPDEIDSEMIGWILAAYGASA